MKNKRLFGLIGYPLGHSFSKKYFTEKFENEGISDCQFELFPIEKIEALPKLLNENPNLEGFNVTIPYKEKVLTFLNELDITAEKIRAVNCVKISRRDNKLSLKGFNTDAYGFEMAVKPLLNENHKKALLLGTGGASKAVKFILERLGLECVYVSRTKKDGIIGYSDVNNEVLNAYQVIVNCSPIGMAPNTELAPNIPYAFINKEHVLYDLVYNPLDTKFLKLGKAQGAVIENGLSMLHGQAEKAWEIWNDPEC